MFPLSHQPEQSPQEIERLLWDRSTAEIAARLLRRAELHDQDGRHYLRRCAALDRVAAHKIQQLEQQAGSDMANWQQRRDTCLRLLREGHN